MTHINDLPAAVLAQILYNAAATPAKRLSEWKIKMPLLAVCRTWTKLAIGTVFDQVYVEVAASRRSALKARPLWTSNAELFISRGCILAAKRLTVEWVNHATPNHLHYIVLDVLQLDCVDWQCIYSLTISKAFRKLNLSVEPVSRHKPAVIDLARVVQYFSQNLRSIVELNFYHLNHGPAGKYLYDNLIVYYGQQLQFLRAYSPVQFPASCFMRNIKLLELFSDLPAARALPSISGETLRVLKLTNISRKFAWHHFRYDLFARLIVFRRLIILHIAYDDGSNVETSEDKIQDRIASGVHNCDQLSFPALKELYIEECTPDCDLLYADLPLPKLKKVRLFGSTNSSRHCSRLKLTWVRDLSVVIIQSDSGDMADIYRATNRLFTDVCIGRSASLNITIGKFDLDPELIRWVNLTKLEVFNVNYTAFCKAIGRLPNLTEFRTVRLIFGSVEADNFPGDASLFISADLKLVWGEKLERVGISGIVEGCPSTICDCGIEDLIMHAVALRGLKVPESIKQFVFEFIYMHKDQYPHLVNLTVY
ncbi:hypothetical protein GGH94_006061 [Coemansia aciculifera]|uniref:Uncharacterized protein n=1 Tax=Coemansia aciculifera TaxID=417176 RepID=A0A9W8IL73_9FUNG|nr:hypothetical protein GGH94_006061 [Coemansia aciculifera]